ncbi:MAG: hypothetical protein WKF55_02685 [Gemmatimonadaceae bacterium]
MATFPRMATPSPYRTLIPERRVALVLYALRTTPEARERYVQRLVKRGGGFRAATLRTWPVDRLAREVVRVRAEDSQDELDLLQLLYVDLEPAIQVTFLDAAGVEHTDGKISEDLEPPYADASSVRRAADVVLDKHGDDGARYLQTLARYSLGWWPEIDLVVNEMASAAPTDTVAATDTAAARDR